MGNWEWLVPVIILVIWIVNYALRGGEEDAAAKRNRPAAGRQGQRKSTTEIDRFLEEVNRRRKQATDRPKAPQPRQAAAAPAPAPTRPARPVSPARQPSVRPPVTPRVSRPAPERRTPARTPVVEREVVEAIPVEPLSLSAAAAAAAYQQPPTPGVLPAVANVGEASVSLATENLLALLSSADTQSTAIVLHEIFGPPRCRRYGIH